MLYAGASIRTGTAVAYCIDVRERSSGTPEPPYC
jgi:hypothetical protein